MTPMEKDRTMTPMEAVQEIASLRVRAKTIHECCDCWDASLVSDPAPVMLRALRDHADKLTARADALEARLTLTGPTSAITVMGDPVDAPLEPDNAPEDEPVSPRPVGESIIRSAAVRAGVDHYRHAAWLASQGMGS